MNQIRPEMSRVDGGAHLHWKAHPAKLHHAAAHADRADDPAPGIDIDDPPRTAPTIGKCLQPSPRLDDRRQPVSHSAYWQGTYCSAMNLI